MSSRGPKDPSDQSSKGKSDKKSDVEKSLEKLKGQTGDLARKAIKVSNEKAGITDIEELQRRADAMSEDADVMFFGKSKRPATPDMDKQDKDKQDKPVVPPLKIPPYREADIVVEDQPESEHVTATPSSITSSSATSTKSTPKTPTTQKSTVSSTISSTTSTSSLRSTPSIPTPTAIPLPKTPVTPPPSPATPTSAPSTPRASGGFFSKVWHAAVVFASMVGYGFTEAFQSAKQNWTNVEMPETTIFERQISAINELTKSIREDKFASPVSKISKTPTTATSVSPAVSVSSATSEPSKTPTPVFAPPTSKEEEKPIRKSPAWRGAKAIVTQKTAEQRLEESIDALKHEWLVAHSARPDLPLDGKDGLEAYAKKKWGEYSKTPDSIKKFKNLQISIPDLFEKIADQSTSRKEMPSLIKTLGDQINIYDQLYKNLERDIERQHQETGQKPKA